MITVLEKQIEKVAQLKVEKSKLEDKFKEMRKFEKGQIIASEMEEALEIIFIEQGRYNVGYEINKNPFYRVRFGEST